MRKRLYLLPVILALIFLLANCGKKAEKPKSIVRPVKSMLIKKRGDIITRNFPGKVIANKKSKLSFRVAGKLIELPVLEGDKLKKGQLVARLDPKRFKDQVDETHARYIWAKSQYERAQKLIKGNFISKSDYDKTRSDFLIVKSNLETAKRDLSYTYIYAPFAGYVATKYVDNHEFVKEKQPIIYLQYIAKIDIEINVPENLMINLKDSDPQREPVAIFEPIPNKEFKVTLKEFSADADPETRTYRVIYTMLQPKDVNILPGMSASIRVGVPDYKGGTDKFIRIPSSAVFMSANNETSVWLIDSKNMTLKRQPIKVSRLSDKDIHVISGLEPGQRIVTAGVHFLKEGEKVRLLKDE
jgi:RND family efflux transporter MFP subunit